MVSLRRMETIWRINKDITKDIKVSAQLGSMEYRVQQLDHVGLCWVFIQFSVSSMAIHPYALRGDGVCVLKQFAEHLVGSMGSFGSVKGSIYLITTRDVTTLDKLNVHMEHSQNLTSI